MFQDKKEEADPRKKSTSNTHYLANSSNVLEGKSSKDNSQSEDSLDIDLPSRAMQNLSSSYNNAESLVTNYYNKLVSWLDQSSGIVHEKLENLIQPLKKSVSEYIDQIDVREMQKKFYSYSDTAIKEILDTAIETRKSVVEFINTDENATETPSYMRYLRTGLSCVGDVCSYCGSKIKEFVSPYVNYVGEAVLGKDNYQWIADKLNQSMLVIQQYIQDLITKIFGRNDKDEYLLKPELESSRISQVSVDLVNQGREVIGQIDSLIKVATDYFGEKKEDFLSHRITDNKEDGIREKQPDVIRQELLGDLARKASNPFPSYEDRKKDQREHELRRAKEDLQLDNGLVSYVRTGVDGEMSAIDKLEVGLKGKVTV